MVPVTPRRRTDEADAREFAQRNSAFVADVVNELLGTGQYEYDNGSGGSIRCRLFREGARAQLNSHLDYYGSRKAHGYPNRSVSGSQGHWTLISDHDLVSPYSAMSEQVAGLFAEMLSRAGWRREKRQRYNGPVEIWVEGTKWFDAHGALGAYADFADIAGSDQRFIGRLSWKGHLAELSRAELSSLAGVTSEVRFPDGRTGEAVMEDKTDGRVQGLSEAPF
jgi:hypothetical protein